ncbi:MAG: MerR family transcriptional regulator [Verrucomicrobiae bacterium]|nr:MerR family transcriptional regulator [Verrucomicrobiae bacterium]
MPNLSDSSSDEVFGIGAVSRLTGISPHVLRIWERRYEVVEPDRSESRHREYSRDDVRRLSLVKALVDHGHSIRHVARLSTDQLEKQLNDIAPSDHVTPARRESERSDTKPEGSEGLQEARIAFVGTLLRDEIRKAVDLGPGMNLIGDFSSFDALRETLKPESTDLVVAECPTLFEEQIREIQELVTTLKARRAIIVYRFARNSVIEPLDKDLRMVTAMRAPVNAAELRLACTADLRLPPVPSDAEANRAAEEISAKLDDAEDGIPPRLFSDESLARIARHSSVVQCECPQHLANILSSLSAFESYSAECENRNEEDAKLHAYLHRATAECRSEMESALRHLIQVEGISIDS